MLEHKKLLQSSEFLLLPGCNVLYNTFKGYDQDSVMSCLHDKQKKTCVMSWPILC